MCVDPLTGAFIATSVLSAGAGIVGRNSAISSQAQSVNRQAERAYAENTFNYIEDARVAREEGYTAEMAKRQAVGSARTLGSTLGIRGATARDLVTAEKQVGNYNVATAADQQRGAERAYKVGTAHTRAAAGDHLDALEASAPSAFEQILTLSTAGLSGWAMGSQASSALGGTPKTPRKPTG